MIKFQPYGSNILVKPVSKNKIIGDTSRFFLFGEVLATGELVSHLISVGDTICYTQWGMNKIEDEEKNEHFFVQDNPDFVLGIIKHEKTN